MVFNVFAVVLEFVFIDNEVNQSIVVSSFLRPWVAEYTKSSHLLCFCALNWPFLGIVFLYLKMVNNIFLITHSSFIF